MKTIKWNAKKTSDKGYIMEINFSNENEHIYNLRILYGSYIFIDFVIDFDLSKHFYAPICRNAFEKLVSIRKKQLSEYEQAFLNKQVIDDLYNFVTESYEEYMSV